jgi:hypothetical protein
MGVDLHITRAETWCYSEENPITKDEWLAYVDADKELELVDGSGYVIWHGLSKHSEPWLEWSKGEIKTKYPDTALYIKMLLIASALSAHVEDDDGQRYQLPSEWNFDPSERNRSPNVTVNKNVLGQWLNHLRRILK